MTLLPKHIITGARRRSLFELYILEPEGDLVAELTLSMPLESELNMHQCWMARYSRSKRQQKRVYIELLSSWGRQPRPANAPDQVELTRYCSRQFDQGNTEACFKHVQDGVAEFWGVRDGRNDPIYWVYNQIQTPGCEGKVRIKMTWRKEKHEDETT